MKSSRGKEHGGGELRRISLPHTLVNRAWRKGQEEERPGLEWSLALSLALCPKDGDGVGIRAHYRSARRVGDATTGEGQNIL